jgi:hypothetical protein
MYIVIWNFNSRDSHISVDSRGFIEQYSTKEDAIADSEEAQDHFQYRNYKVIEI